MRLVYTVDINDEISEIEAIHNHFDSVMLSRELDISKSTLESDGSLGEITEHDSKQKCRVCGCDWFHACEGGCYWVEEDLCSSCTERIFSDPRGETSEMNDKEKFEYFKAKGFINPEEKFED